MGGREEGKRWWIVAPTASKLSPEVGMTSQAEIDAFAVRTDSYVLKSLDPNLIF